MSVFSRQAQQSRTAAPNLAEKPRLKLRRPLKASRAQARKLSYRRTIERKRIGLAEHSCAHCSAFVEVIYWCVNCSDTDTILAKKMTGRAWKWLHFPELEMLQFCVAGPRQDACNEGMDFPTMGQNITT